MKLRYVTMKAKILIITPPESTLEGWVRTHLGCIMLYFSSVRFLVNALQLFLAVICFLFDDVMSESPDIGTRQSLEVCCYLDDEARRCSKWLLVTIVCMRGTLCRGCAEDIAVSLEKHGAIQRIVTDRPTPCEMLQIVLWAALGHADALMPRDHVREWCATVSEILPSWESDTSPETSVVVLVLPRLWVSLLCAVSGQKSVRLQHCDVLSVEAPPQAEALTNAHPWWTLRRWFDSLKRPQSDHWPMKHAFATSIMSLCTTSSASQEPGAKSHSDHDHPEQSDGADADEGPCCRICRVSSPCCYVCLISHAELNAGHFGRGPCQPHDSSMSMHRLTGACSCGLPGSMAQHISGLC